MGDVLRGKSTPEATLWPIRVAYADPPYPGYARYYRDHPDYDGEVDHAELIARMTRDYDGWVLHTRSSALRELLPLCPESARVAPWTKPFCSFKPGINPAYAWEPIILWGGRKRGRGVPTMRDYISANPARAGRAFIGAKPADVCCYVFDFLGMRPEDELDDLFPGSGAVTRAWDDWRNERAA